MFVTVFTFRAKAGRENAVIAHLERWNKELRPASPGYVSGSLLRDVRDPRNFITYANFTDQAASQSVANRPEQDAWYRQLVTLCESEPVFTDCTVAAQFT